jgi:hypothetical protein
LLESDPKVVGEEIDELVSYLLSIDEDKSAPVTPTMAGAQGGFLCPDSFTAP